MGRLLEKIALGQAVSKKASDHMIDNGVGMRSDVLQLPVRLALGVACLICGCGGGTPTSPTQVVVGLWHGVSVVQTAGEVSGGFSREHITLRADGTAAIVEYEGSMRSDVGTWSLSGSAISIDFPSFCDRRGTVTGDTMNLACTLDTRTWALVYEKR